MVMLVQQPHNLCGGNTYTVNVTDSTCYATSYLVQMPPILRDTGSLAFTYVSCSYANVTAAMLNTNSNVTYLWSNGDTTKTVNNLFPGNYWCIISDSCKKDTMNFSINSAASPLRYSLDSLLPCSNTKCNGYYKLTIWGGVTPYNVTWSNGQSAVINYPYSFMYDTAICANQKLSFIITDACGHVIHDTVKMGSSLPYNFHIDKTVLKYACPGACNGIVKVYPLPSAPGYPNYTYTWSNGVTGPVLINVCPDSTYKVRAIDGCGKKDSLKFKFPRPLPLVATVFADPTCKNICNGSASVLITGGVPNYQLLWSTGSKSNLIYNLCYNTNYSIKVSDTCGTIYRDTFQLGLRTPVSGSITGTSSCSNLCNGTAILSVNSGTFPFQTLWSTGQTNVYNISNVCFDSTYSCIITDFCSSKDTAKVKIGKAGSTSILLGNSASCVGLCNGTAYVVVQTGVAPFQIQWSNGQTNVPNIINACYDSTYTCVVTDYCNSSDTAKVKIPKAAHPTGFITPSINICTNTCNGTATLNYTNLFPPYYFYWNTGTIAQTATNLCKDSSYYCVLSSIGCSADTFRVRMPNYYKMNVTLISKQPSCFVGCTGSASIKVTSGVSPYTYLWSNGQTIASANTLCAGWNTCMVTDACGRIDTFKVLIPTLAGPKATVNSITKSCILTCTATATVVGSLGVPPYTYLWSNGQTSTNATALCAGSNYCVVMDACGRTDTAKFNVQTLPTITGAVAQANPSCFAICNGSATCSITSGISPYTYLWSNGQTTPTATLLCSGNNWCIATDNCTSKDTINFNISIYPHVAASVTQLNPSCANICNGSAICNASSGLPPYHYLWNNGQTTKTATGLCLGADWCIVTDSCGIKDTVRFSISKYHADSAFVNVTSKSCPNICNGTATCMASNGLVPYTYKWSNGVSNNLPTNSTLCPGNNWCVAIDVCLSKDSVSFFINTYLFQPLHAFSNAYWPSCPNNCSGVASAAAIGGVLPYSYKWSSGFVGTPATNLCTGNNYLYVTDYCLNKDTLLFSVIATQSLLVSVDTQTQACSRVCNGRAVVRALGGRAPYHYLWSNGQTTSFANNLCIGVYTCIVSDSCNEKDTVKITIHQVSPLVVTNTTQTNSNCYQPCNGSFSVSLNGGMPPIKYTWSNGATTNSQNNLCPGQYHLLISDSFCIADTMSYNINIQSIMNISATAGKNVLCHDSCTGQATVQAVGGTLPYQYFWNNINRGWHPTDLCASTYFIKVTDNTGCSCFDTISITEPPKIIIDTIFNNCHCNQSNGNILVNVSGGVAPYNYLWNNNSTSNFINNIPSGNYSITVTDSNLCKVTNSYFVQCEYPHLSISHDTLVGLGQPVQLNISGALTYFWVPSTNLSCDSCSNPIWTGKSSTTYCAIGLDAWNCADTNCVNVTIFDDCGKITMPTAFSPNNDGHNDTYHPLGLCILSVHYSIFNRWGEKVFESFSMQNTWDGMYNGVKAPSDVYVWYLEAVDYYKRETHTQGNVTLLR